MVPAATFSFSFSFFAFSAVLSAPRRLTASPAGSTATDATLRLASVVSRRASSLRLRDDPPSSSARSAAAAMSATIASPTSRPVASPRAAAAAVARASVADDASPRAANVAGRITRTPFSSTDHVAFAA